MAESKDHPIIYSAPIRQIAVMGAVRAVLAEGERRLIRARQFLARDDLDGARAAYTEVTECADFIRDAMMGIAS